MRYRIAIICTPILKAELTKVLKKLDVDFDFYMYSSFKDVPQIFKEAEMLSDAVVTSGIFPATVILKSFPETEKPISYFNSDDGSTYRLFFRLLIENPELDLEGVYCDFLDIIGLEPKEYLTKEQRANYSDMVDSVVVNIPLEELYEMEANIANKHKSLFKEGKIEASITRFSSIINELIESGCNSYFVYPSEMYLTSVFEKVIQELTIMDIKKSLPAVINLSLDTTKLPEKRELLLQENYMLLQNAITQFFGNIGFRYVLQKTRFGFEILSDYKTLSEYTHKFTQCEICDFLENTVDFNCFIGYGIGFDISQARLNAINAVQESALKGDGSYLINENKELIGPFEKGTKPNQVSVIYEADVGVRAKGLSPITLNRVISAIKNSPDKQLTAKELGLQLSVTTRSANRFLTALMKSGIVEVRNQKRSTTKGRPESVYGLSLKKKKTKNDSNKETFEKHKN